jgi:hypothetical protein
MAISLPQTIGVREYAENVENKEQELSVSQVSYPSSYAVKLALDSLDSPKIERTTIDWTSN